MLRFRYETCIDLAIDGPTRAPVGYVLGGIPLFLLYQVALVGHGLVQRVLLHDLAVLGAIANGPLVLDSRRLVKLKTFLIDTLCAKRLRCLGSHVAEEPIFERNKIWAV